MIFKPSNPGSGSLFFRERSLVFRGYRWVDIWVGRDVVDPTSSSRTGIERPDGLELGLWDCDVVL